MFKETKGRSVKKSIGWRILAIINSYIILAMYITDSPLYNAILMNVTEQFCIMRMKECGIIHMLGGI